MKWFTKKEFDGRGESKKRESSIDHPCNVLKFIRHLIEKLLRKLPKFDTILGAAIILVAFIVVGKITYLSMSSNVNGIKILSEVSVLKKSFLYQETFDEIASKLMVYDAKIKDKPLEFIRLGKDHDGGYVVPVEAVEASDALIGYGIADDISFEREFSQRFDKPSFGFDCGVQNIETGDSRCHFFSECIGTSKYLFSNQVSSGHISTFSNQLQRMGLIGKKIFVKMDIEGAEFDVIDDILSHVKNITGIVLEIHISNRNPKRALETLSSINDHFILVHLHGNNFSNSYFKTRYSSHSIPEVFELTYINKNLLSSYKISKNQKHPHPIDQRDCINIPECEFEIIPMD